jgi:hypothetical protein
MSIKDRLIKNSTVSLTQSLDTSDLFSKKDMYPTKVPIINAALSAELDGGLSPGILVVAGPSKHFKTGFSLLLAKAFLDANPEGILLFYDSEFGSPNEYFNSHDIDLSRVVHTPITNIEEFKFDIMKQLGEITKKDKVMILIDSIGNLASKKEVDDALDGKSVADMTRAKALKSLGRMITSHLFLKNIPLVAINHTYKEIGLYPKDIVSGGTGFMYSANDVWILGRQQDKDGTELEGYHFIINIEKSRYIIEKSKFPVTVSFDGGIQKWSGLLELALEGNYIAKPKNGWYAVVDRTTGELKEPNMREKDINSNNMVWLGIIANTDFSDFVRNKYKLSTAKMIQE